MMHVCKQDVQKNCVSDFSILSGRYEHLYTYRREEFRKIFEKINCAIALDS